MLTTNHTHTHTHTHLHAELGLYFGPGGSLDFGSVFTNSGNVLRDLSLLYNGKGAATIVNARIGSCLHSVGPEGLGVVAVTCPQITFHFDQPSLAPGIWANMGHVRLSTVKRDLIPGQYRGQLSVEYRTSADNTIQLLAIPFVFDALEGSLEMAQPDTIFFAQGPVFSKQINTVNITNNFPFPLMISKIALPMNVQSVLQVS